MDEEKNEGIASHLPPLRIENATSEGGQKENGLPKPSSLSRDQIAEIAKNFKASLNALKRLPIPIDNDTSGIPIFTKDDIATSLNEPDVMLRMLFIRFRVTRLRFARQFKKYAVSVLCIAELNINAQRENFLRNIRTGNITWTKFKQVVEVILGLKMTKIAIDYIGLDGSKVCIEAETGEITGANRQNMPAYTRITS